MKNVYEVLRQKELELARLEKEVEALRVAAPLLSDDKDSGVEAGSNKPTLAATPNPNNPSAFRKQRSTPVRNRRARRVGKTPPSAGRNRIQIKGYPTPSKSSSGVGKSAVNRHFFAIITDLS